MLIDQFTDQAVIADHDCHANFELAAGYSSAGVRANERAFDHSVEVDGELSDHRDQPCLRPSEGATCALLRRTPADHQEESRGAP